jgi:hypothetical protein
MARATIQPPNREDAISSSISFSGKEALNARPCCGSTAEHAENKKLADCFEGPRLYGSSRSATNDEGG